MTSFFNFATQPVEVEIKLNGEAERRQVEVKGEKEKKEMCPVYYDGESVIGQVSSQPWLPDTRAEIAPAGIKSGADRGDAVGHSTSEGWTEIPT